MIKYTLMLWLLAYFIAYPLIAIAALNTLFPILAINYNIATLLAMNVIIYILNPRYKFIAIGVRK